MANMKSHQVPVSTANRDDSTGKEKNIKKPMIITAVVVILAVIFSLFLIGNTTKKISQGEISGIEKAVSKDTGQLFVAGATSDWWRFIADSSYDSKTLAKLDPFVENKDITRLGYAQYTNPDESIKSGGPLRITYLETKNNEAAEALKQWFEGKNNEAAPYNVRIKDNLVAIGPNWAFDNSLYFSDNGLGLDTDYIQNTSAANRNGEIGFAYIDFQKYFEGMLASQKDADTKIILNEYIKNEFGLKDKSGIWMGNAATYNSLWKGKFIKGGFDAETLDPEKASDIIQGRQKLISDNGEEMIIDPRESTLLENVFVAAPGKSSEESIKSFKEFFTPYNSAFEKEGYTENNSLLRGAVNIPEWNSILSATGQKEERLSTIIFAGKKDEMVFTFIPNRNI